MSNELYKQTGYDPAGLKKVWHPGTAGTPAYCVDQVTSGGGGGVWLGDGHYVYDYEGNPATGRPPGPVFIPDSGPIGGVPGHSTVPTITHKCYPATPGTPGYYTDVPSFAINHNQGWTGGAFSVGQLDADGMYQFSVPRNSAGVITGFSNSNTGTGYGEMTHAIYAGSGSFKIIESGTVVWPGGSYSDSDVFTIARVSNGVAYYRNGTLVYQSATLSYGATHADCSLYLAEDKILDAALTDTVTSPFDLPPGSGGVPLPPHGTKPPDPYGDDPRGSVPSVLRGMVGYFSDHVGADLQHGVLPSMQGHFVSDPNNQLIGVMPGLTGSFTTEDASGMAGVLPGMTGYFEANLIVPDFAVLDGVLGSMVAFFLSHSGGVGYFDSVLGRLRGHFSDLPDYYADIVNDGAPIPPIIYDVVGGGTGVTKYHDTFTGNEAMDVHQPDVGNPYYPDGGATLDGLVLTGGHLPIGDGTNTNFYPETPIAVGTATTITVKHKLQIDAIVPGDALSVDIALDNDDDDWFYEWYLQVDGSGALLLSAYVYGADGSDLFQLELIDISLLFTLGVLHDLWMAITPAGVSWTLDGVEVANSGGVLSDGVIQNLEQDVRSSSVGTHGFIDEAEVVVGGSSGSGGISVPIGGGVDPITGDWPGRGGGQLRSLVAWLIDDVVADRNFNAAKGAIILPSPLLVDGHVTTAGSLVGNVVLPSPLTTEGAFGWRFETKLPSLQADVEMTLMNVMRANIRLPRLQAFGVGTVGTIFGTADNYPIQLPRLGVLGTVSAEGAGMVLLPALQAKGQISTDSMLQAKIRLPALRGAGSIINPFAVDPQNPLGRFLQGHVVLPALRMDSSALQADLELPALRLVGHVAIPTTGEARMGYAMNLRTGAVTEFTNYPFRAMGRAHNLYWGIGLDGNLYRLQGDTDDTLPIDWEWLSGLNDFAVWGRKGMLAVYLRAVFENGATVTVQTDDSAVRVYDHKAAGDYKNQQVHRVPLGKGVRSDAFAFGMANPKGGYIELDKVTPEYVIISRNL